MKSSSRIKEFILSKWFRSSTASITMLQIGSLLQTKYNFNVFIISSIVPTDIESLQQLTNNKCTAFLIDEGISFPQDFTSKNSIALVKIKKSNTQPISPFLHNNEATELVKRLSNYFPESSQLLQTLLKNF